mgnify:CR=1 FL=1
MIARFVLGDYINVKDKERRILIHASSLYDDPHPKTRKMRRPWIQSMIIFSAYYCSAPGLKQKI